MSEPERPAESWDFNFTEEWWLACCKKPDDCKWGGTGPCRPEVRERLLSLCPAIHPTAQYRCQLRVGHMWSHSVNGVDWESGPAEAKPERPAEADEQAIVERGMLVALGCNHGRWLGQAQLGACVPCIAAALAERDRRQEIIEEENAVLVTERTRLLHEISTLAAGQRLDWNRSKPIDADAPPVCVGCGGPHPFDTTLPSVIWNRVIRGGGLPDYLCTTCIVRAFVVAGESFTAELWGSEFPGVPIEVRVRGAEAMSAAEVSNENTALRSRLRSPDA